MWKDTNSTPSIKPIFDEFALDSGENIYLGLMVVRLHLGNEPIQRVGAFVAWNFKKWRFNRIASTLGIVQQFYFHGFASADDTNIQVPPSELEKLTKDSYDDELDHKTLLLSAKWDIKRQNRWQQNPQSLINKGLKEYSQRLSELREKFPETFQQLDIIERAANAEIGPSNLEEFGKAFHKEVMEG